MRPLTRSRRFAAFAMAVVVALAGCGGSDSSSSKEKAAAGPATGPAATTQSQPGTEKQLARAHDLPTPVKRAAAKQAAKLPTATVATVAGQAITLSEYNAAYRARVAALPGGAPDPPAYPHCISAFRKQFAQFEKRMSETAKSGPLAQANSKRPKPRPPSRVTLRKQCAQLARSVRPGVMTQLIQARWSALEAQARHLTVSDKEVDAAIAQQRKVFKTQALWKENLKRMGTTAQGLRGRTRAMLLNQRLTASRAGSRPTVSDGQVRSYFDAHRAQFGLPERRNLQVLLTKSRSGARQAKAALKKGMSWKTAVHKWSVDSATKASGGALLGIVKGSGVPALDRLAFTSKPHVLVGPVKANTGWYLARVTKVIAAQRPDITQYKARIRMLLQNQERARRTAAANAAYERRWRAKTVCKPGYVVPLCANAEASARP